MINSISNKAIIEIIEINKVVKAHGMEKLSTLSEIKHAPYSELIKPLRNEFEKRWGCSPNLYIKKLL